MSRCHSFEMSDLPRVTCIVMRSGHKLSVVKGSCVLAEADNILRCSTEPARENRTVAIDPGEVALVYLS